MVLDQVNLHLTDHFMAFQPLEQYKFRQGNLNNSSILPSLCIESRHYLHIDLSSAMQCAGTTFETCTWFDMQHHVGLVNATHEVVVQLDCSRSFYTCSGYSLRVYLVHFPTDFPTKLDIISTLLLSYQDVTTTDLSLLTFCVEARLPCFSTPSRWAKGIFLT